MWQPNITAEKEETIYPVKRCTSLLNVLAKNYSILQGFHEIFLIRFGFKNLSTSDLINPVSYLSLQVRVVFGIFLQEKGATFAQCEVERRKQEPYSWRKLLLAFSLIVWHGFCRFPIRKWFQRLTTTWVAWKMMRRAKKCFAHWVSDQEKERAHRQISNL